MHRDRNPPHSTLPCEGFVEHGIRIAVERHARTQLRRHFLRIDAVALGTIDPESAECPIAVEEAETVAVGKRSHSRHIE